MDTRIHAPFPVEEVIIVPPDTTRQTQLRHTPRPKGTLRLLSVAGVIMVMIIAILVVYVPRHSKRMTTPAWLKPSRRTGATQTVVEREATETGGMALRLPPMQVNLSGSNSSRQLTLVLVVDVQGKAAKAKVDRMLTSMRHELLLLISRKRTAELRTQEGKSQLLADVTAHLNTLLGSVQVTNTYFSEFLLH